MRSRLTVENFDFPVNEIRRGYRSASYFFRAKKILEADGKADDVVTMQVFQKGNSVLCGMDEALGILKVGAGRYTDLRKAELAFDELIKHKRYAAVSTDRNTKINQLVRMQEAEMALDDLWESHWDRLEVEALYDGDEVVPWEPVMLIRGPLASFVHLESVYLGVLARRTKVATNVRRVCDAAGDKPLLFFADRFDHYATQGGDGYAANIGGARGVASDAMGAWWGEPGLGTMPHALIAAYHGNTVRATAAFGEYIPGVNLIALVDFNNDCVADTMACAREFGNTLWGVRLDTSENLVDNSLWPSTSPGGPNIPKQPLGDFKPTGVNAALVHNVRNALDAEGYTKVKIIVSGGFNVEKITAFEKARVPVDSYAVGSSLLQGSVDFTADVVEPTAKVGRWLRNSERLEVVQ